MYKIQARKIEFIYGVAAIKSPHLAQSFPKRDITPNLPDIT